MERVVSKSVGKGQTWIIKLTANMGKTVTTYLIDGDPKGTQYVFIINKICQMYVMIGV